MDGELVIRRVPLAELPAEQLAALAQLAATARRLAAEAGAEPALADGERAPETAA